MRILILVVGAIAAFPAASQGLPDFVKLTAAGRVECSNPDPLARTSSSMARYRRAADGTLETVGTMAARATPLITVEMRAPLTASASELCSDRSKWEIDGMHVPVDGKANPDFETRMKAIMRAALAPPVKPVCTRYVADGDGFIEHAFVDGVARPEQDGRVVFIDPAGYRLAPRARPQTVAPASE